MDIVDYILDNTEKAIAGKKGFIHYALQGEGRRTILGQAYNKLNDRYMDKHIVRIIEGMAVGSNKQFLDAIVKHESPDWRNHIEALKQEPSYLFAFVHDFDYFVSIADPNYEMSEILVTMKNLHLTVTCSSGPEAMVLLKNGKKMSPWSPYSHFYFKFVHLKENKA